MGNNRTLDPIAHILKSLPPSITVVTPSPPSLSTLPGVWRALPKNICKLSFNHPIPLGVYNHHGIMVSDTIRESELKNYEPEIPVQIVTSWWFEPI